MPDERSKMRENSELNGAGTRMRMRLWVGRWTGLLYGRHLVATGDVEQAKHAVGHAVELWQPIRVEIVADDAPARIW